MNFLGHNSGAVFSDCGQYRYALWRRWDETKPFCMFIGLNPSTADEATDDPTIRRCVRFARDWGFGGLLVGNLFALISTQPSGLRYVSDPVGERNDELLVTMQRESGRIVVAWGAVSPREIPQVGDWYCLGVTKHGQPKHPLYLRADTKLTLWRLWFGAKTVPTKGAKNG